MCEINNFANCKYALERLYIYIYMYLYALNNLSFPPQIMRHFLIIDYDIRL